MFIHRNRRHGIAWLLGAVMGLGTTTVAVVPAHAAPLANPKTAASPRAQFQPSVGQERAWDVTSTGVATIDLQRLAAQVSPSGSGAPRAAGTKSHQFTVSARVGARVVGRVDGRWIVAMKLENTSYVVDGQRDARSSALEVPFVVRVSDRGEFVAFDFPLHYPTEGQVAIRSLVEPLQVVFGDVTEDGAWTVGERSSAGSSTVRYAVTGADASGIRLSRTVTAAKRALLGATADDQRGQFRTTVDASSGEVLWAADGSGLESLSIVEKTTSVSGGARVASTDLTLSARRAAANVAGLPRTLEAAQASLRDMKLARASFYKVPGALLEHVQGIDWPTARAYYFDKVGTARSETVLLMQMWLRLNPQHADRFVDALNEASLGERTPALEDVVGYGFAALGSAGHTEAQRAIVKALGNDAYTDLTRQKALDGLLSVEMPETFVPAAVWQYREEVRLRDGTALELLSIATNVYGQMGNATLGVKENTDVVVRTLGQLLQSRDAYEQRRGLVALGNVASADTTLPLVERFFDHGNEMLRTRAYDVFMRSAKPAHFAEFTRRFERERSTFVRREAFVVAMSMADSSARTAWALEQARSSSDTVIQQRAAAMIGQAIEDRADNAVALREMLSFVKDREVRRLIYAFIPPTKGKQ
ncbi:MAG: hypothetical protein FJ137_00015 [Deltaproteobacteria bacterium]|nr:hypothetical protein [Deltaproteobacteria bacterium]